MTEADGKILACLKERRSFLIDAGAGSGKTTSLIRALDYVRGPNRKSCVMEGQRVACITFTNVAKNEIAERTDHDTLFEVSTIHDFLWGAIKAFQKELKPALLAFNAELPHTSRRKKDQSELEAALKNAPTVSYSDRGANFLEGRIYHDDLLGVAHVMFRSHPMLARLIAARYPFIFVDEYQDTDPAVVEILIDHLHKAHPQPLIGFFGDKVQSIYPGGVGELSADQQAQLEIIQKEENYRCSMAVIDVLNKVRTDIRQEPSGKNLEGRAVYVNLAGMDPAADITDAALTKAREAFGIDLSGKELKVLFLTHRLIARKAGYEGLWTAYNARSSFAKDNFQSGNDPIANFLSGTVAATVEQWREGKTGATIRTLKRSGTTLASAEQKAKTKAALNTLANLAETASVGDVLRHIQTSGLLVILDDLAEGLAGNYPEAEQDSFEERYQSFIETLLALPFREISIYRAVSESHLPFTTKHGVKGDEFDNVLVILDDAGANWNQYSFGNLLADNETNANRLIRTRNLFYVCCSRAKDTLVVAHMGDGNRAKMEELFGTDRVAI